jgi:pimeloyl-ACP methyl ester carboxylesterase
VVLVPLRLHVEVVGSGPALCLVHGFGGSARNFRPQVRAFRDARRVVTFDLRGHARSEAPGAPEAYTIDTLVADIGNVLDQVEAPTAVLGGVSLGAALALEFTLRQPERVSGLVLASFPAGGAAERWALPFADAIEREGLEAAGSRFVWGGDRFDPPAAALIRTGFLEHSAMALSAILRGLLGRLDGPRSFLERARELDRPVLLVSGEHDFGARESASQLAAVLPRSTRRDIPDAGHVVNLQAPTDFNASLADFLNENDI